MKNSTKANRADLRHLGNMRHFRGNMLMLVTLCIAILILVIALGLSIQYYFFSNKNLQFCADQFATATAAKLNENDHIGQINNLTAYSRELVFNSHNSYNTIVTNCPQFTNLSNRFYMESRQGANLVERGREQLLNIILAAARNSLLNANNSGYFGQETTLPWAKSSTPTVVNLRLGSIKKVESNVQSPYGNDALLKFDTQSGYIDPISHLYYGNCILQLPEDDDKKFLLASLPAPVNGIVAPAKLTSSQTFQWSSDILKEGQDALPVCQQLPSSVQVDLQMFVTNRVLLETKNTATVESTAATNGAYPPITN